MLRLREVAETLRRLDWRNLEAEWVVVFGSLAERGEGRDVDLLVKHKGGKGGSEWRIRVVTAVADALGIDYSLVDVVEAEPDTPCPIIRSAWRYGLIVYEEERGAAKEWMLRRVIVCWDYEVAAKKLGVVETAVEAARRRWRG
jgi:predicted nucleotidyltransferase